jgi:hypothetical protein
MIGTLALAIFPARTYMEQRHGLVAEGRRVRVLNDQNRQLSAEVRRLDTDAEIERLARQQYNLVKPGEEAYAILPPTAPPKPETPAPPPNKPHRSFWYRLFH